MKTLLFNKQEKGPQVFILSLMVFMALVFHPRLSKCQAQEHLWGLEFTFSSNELGDLYNEEKFFNNTDFKYRKVSERVHSELVAVVEKNCSGCQLKLVSEGASQVVFPDRYWIQIATDPGVIEIQAKPATLKQYQKLKARFDILFESAAQIGLFPDTFMSGGHIHVGLAAFKNNPLLLRNFLVDFTNHFELAEGILDLNPKNASSLRMQQDEFGALDRFKTFIENFDRGTLLSKNHKKIESSEALAKQYYDIVQQGNLYGKSARYQALNLQRHNKGQESTIEIRSIRTQASFDEFLQELTLFEGRLKYLKKLTDKKIRIPLEDYVNSSKLGTKKFDKLLVEKFYRYVTESELRWEEYKPLIYLEELRRKKIELNAPVKAKSCQIYF